MFRLIGAYVSFCWMKNLTINISITSYKLYTTHRVLLWILGSELHLFFPERSLLWNLSARKEKRTDVAFLQKKTKETWMTGYFLRLPIIDVWIAKHIKTPSLFSYNWLCLGAAILQVQKAKCKWWKEIDGDKVSEQTVRKQVSEWGSTPVWIVCDWQRRRTRGGERRGEKVWGFASLNTLSPLLMLTLIQPSTALITRQKTQPAHAAWTSGICISLQQRIKKLLTIFRTWTWNKAGEKPIPWAYILRRRRKREKKKATREKRWFTF